MDILWHILVLALFPWFAILAGMLPVVIYYRVRMILDKNRSHFLYTNKDFVSLLLFDIGIFFTAAYYFYAVIIYIRLGDYHIHAWKDLFIAHAMLGCFAVGMLLRKRQLQLSTDFVKTITDEADKV